MLGKAGLGQLALGLLRQRQRVTVRGVSDEEDDQAPGWEAIDAALDPLYGGREPDRHYGTVLRFSLGGDDPLDGLSAYKVTDRGPAHWHIVSYGMTELYEKVSDDPDESGWGFEFTMRVRCDQSDEDPPMWALNFLQNIARYVFKTGNVFAPGHYMNINGPIALDTDTKICAISFAEPPVLPSSLDSPHGKFGFLHVVGNTLDEHDAMKAWTTTGVHELMRARDPMLLTDLERHSILDDPETATAVEEGRKRDGSSQGGSFVSSLGWEEKGGGLVLRLGAMGVRDFGRLLEGRTRFERAFYIAGPDQQLIIAPAEEAGWEIEGPNVTLNVPEAAVAALESLPAKRGTYQWPELPGLTVIIEPTEVKDADGNVVETIG